jgi:hypothetical protein
MPTPFPFGWRAAPLALASVALAVPLAHAVSEPHPLVASVPASAFTASARSAKVTLPTGAVQVAVRVRVRCGAATSVRLVLDGRTLLRRRVTRRVGQELRVTRAVGPGRHRVGVVPRGRGTSGCRRRLATGAVRFLGAAPSVAPGQTVPGVPSRDDLVSGAGGTSAAPSSTAAPSTVPGPAPVAAPTAPALRWAPPTLVNPTTIAVGQGDRSYALATTKDYILALGTLKHQGSVRINGGRNVVIKGGLIALSTASTSSVGLSISGSVGTVHVEGVVFDGSSGHEFDAIQIAAPKATVQVENVRATGLRGSVSTNHTDIIQPWGGVAKLRVDRLTGDSNYQGIFNRLDQGPIGSVELRHVDLGYDNAGAASGGFLLWMTEGCKAAPTVLDEVYVRPRAGTSLGAAIWPSASDGLCPAVVSGSTASWPKLPITGVVHAGSPAGGPFVPVGRAGLGYLPPGYG